MLSTFHRLVRARLQLVRLTGRPQLLGEPWAPGGGGHVVFLLVLLPPAASAAAGAGWAGGAQAGHGGGVGAAQTVRWSSPRVGEGAVRAAPTTCVTLPVQAFRLQLCWTLQFCTGRESAKDMGESSHPGTT